MITTMMQGKHNQNTDTNIIMFQSIDSMQLHGKFQSMKSMHIMYCAMPDIRLYFIS